MGDFIMRIEAKPRELTTDKHLRAVKLNNRRIASSRCSAALLFSYGNHNRGKYSYRFAQEVILVIFNTKVFRNLASCFL